MVLHHPVKARWDRNGWKLQRRKRRQLDHGVLPEKQLEGRPVNLYAALTLQLRSLHYMITERLQLWSGTKFRNNNIMKSLRSDSRIRYQQTEFIMKLSKARTPKTSGTMAVSRSTTPNDDKVIGSERSTSLDKRMLLKSIYLSIYLPVAERSV